MLTLVFLVFPVNTVFLVETAETEVKETEEKQGEERKGRRGYRIDGGEGRGWAAR